MHGLMLKKQPALAHKNLRFFVETQSFSSIQKEENMELVRLYFLHVLPALNKTDEAIKYLRDEQSIPLPQRQEWTKTLNTIAAEKKAAAASNILKKSTTNSNQQSNSTKKQSQTQSQQTQTQQQSNVSSLPFPSSTKELFNSTSTQQTQPNSQTQQTTQQNSQTQQKWVDFHQSLYDSTSSDSAASPAWNRLTGSNTDSSTSSQTEQIQPIVNSNDATLRSKTISSDAISAVSQLSELSAIKNGFQNQTNSTTTTTTITPSSNPSISFAIDQQLKNQQQTQQSKDSLSSTNKSSTNISKSNGFFKKIQFILKTWFPHLKPYLIAILVIGFAFAFFKIAFGADSQSSNSFLSTKQQTLVTRKRTRIGRNNSNNNGGWFSEITSFVKTLFQM